MHSHRAIGSRSKLIYAVLGTVLLVIGLLGLLIPIIPGVLFIAAAIYVFSKVSRRVRAWSHKSARYRAMHYRFEQLGTVSPVARVRVVALMGVGAFVAGISAIAASVSHVVTRVRR
ncbi:MAG TPA: DUF454 family protein [Pseudomonadales bacterium]|nr:DUF454 family protein [Pseudomonadales bacterium]